MSKVTIAECSVWVINGVEPQPDSDISGIGVITAFLLSAYITFAVVLGAYLLGSIDTGLLRPVDIYIHRLPARRRTSETWHTALRQCVLVFSDQQIVTGVAILTAGFIGLSSRISVYHFQVVISLAWMSSSVHLSCLTMLGQYFRERPALLYWRIAGMLVLFVLLLVALVPTASNLWAIQWTPSGDHFETTGWAIPALCYFFHTYGTGVNPDAPLAYTLLIVSYVWKIGALYRTPRRLFHRYFRGIPEHFLEQILRKEAIKAEKHRKGKLSWKYRAVMVIYVIALSLVEFCASFAASLWLSVVSLVYGTLQIAIPRQQNSWWNGIENVWGFGQVVPIILLIQPLGALLENYRGRQGGSSSSSNSSRRNSHDSTEYELQSTTSPEQLLYQRPAERPKRMSEYFASLDPTKPSERTLELPEHQMAFYHSLLFASLVVWIQVGIVGISSVVFVFDARSLGNTTVSDWFFVLAGLGAFFGVMVVWSVAAIPFSRVFR